MRSSVPQCVNDDPLVRELEAKDIGLKAELAQLEHAFNDANASIPTQPAKASIDSAARELLADGAASLVAADVAEQLNVLQHKMRIVSKAVEFNRRDLEAARDAAGKRIGQTRRPEYVEILKAVKEKATALQTALAAEAEFRRRCERDDVGLASSGMWPAWLNIGHQLDSWMANVKTHYAI